jgi:hypothetical protein
MKQIIVFSALIVILLLTGCSTAPDKGNENIFYHNRNGTIVSMDGNYNTLTKTTNDDDGYTKPKPTTCKLALIQDKTDTTLFLELSTCEDDKPALVDKEWYYNHRIGDPVHFDYIRKDRYFTIQPRAKK